MVPGSRRRDPSHPAAMTARSSHASSPTVSATTSASHSPHAPAPPRRQRPFEDRDLAAPKSASRTLPNSSSPRRHNFDIKIDITLLTILTSPDKLYLGRTFHHTHSKGARRWRKPGGSYSASTRGLESLEKLTEQGRFGSMANTVRDSLQVARALQTQAQNGYTEVVVRNPETHEERVLVLPNLQPGSGR